MSDAHRLSLAEQAMLEGDHASARRIVDNVLASDPSNAEALSLSEALRALEADAAGIPPEALGDLRADARHLEDPALLHENEMGPGTPLGVAILAGLNVIVGGFAAFVGVVAMLAGAGAAILVVLLGLAQLAVGIALWRLRRWAWYAAVVVVGLGVVLNGVGAAQGEVASLLVGLVQLAVLVYLVRVRTRFLGPLPARASPA